MHEIKIWCHRVDDDVRVLLGVEIEKRRDREKVGSNRKSL
jgi:hypothetical protein